MRLRVVFGAKHPRFSLGVKTVRQNFESRRYSGSDHHPNAAISLLR